MWPFSSRRKPVREVPPILGVDHQWEGRVLKVDGSPLVVRFNRSAWNWVGHPELPIKLGFAIPIDHSSPVLPHAIKPHADSVLIEDVILREVNARTKGLYVLALTNTAMREFVFYVPPSTDFAAIHHAIQRNAGGLEVQCMAQEEPSWSAFLAMAGE